MLIRKHKIEVLLASQKCLELISDATERKWANSKVWGQTKPFEGTVHGRRFSFSVNGVRRIFSGTRVILSGSVRDLDGDRCLLEFVTRPRVFDLGFLVIWLGMAGIIGVRIFSHPPISEPFQYWNASIVVVPFIAFTFSVALEYLRFKSMEKESLSVLKKMLFC